MRSSINNLTKSVSAKATANGRKSARIELIEDTTQHKEKRLQSENSVDVTLYVELSILLKHNEHFLFYFSLCFYAFLR